jgi:polar amino acid transport system substrate-binding protein
MKYINGKTLRSVLMTVLCSYLITTSLWATGPRISESNLVPNKNQIYASDYPPFATTELATGGLNSEIINAVLKISNIDAVQTIVPLQSMVKFYLTQDKALAAYARELNFNKNTRKKYIYIPISISVNNYIYYKPAHQTELTWNGSLTSFKGLTYGAYKGENVEQFKQHGITIKTGRVHSLLKKMISNKVDFIKIADLNRNWMFDKYFPDEKNNFSIINNTRTLITLFILFNKQHPNGRALAKKFKSGLSTVVNNGQYQTILEKYVPLKVMREQYMKEFKASIKKYN